jgi:Xaa-Pro dipeptidase
MSKIILTINDMPASLHRKKVLDLFEENQKGIIYLRGAELMYRYGTDYEFPFRQESNFLYLTGVNEPDFHLILDIETHEYHLFMPKRDAQYAVWHGRIKSQEQIRESINPAIFTTIRICLT